VPATKKYRVEVQKDHISKIATGSPEGALAELIWNSFDADANKVELWFHEGAIGIDEILIRDNGIGIPYREAEKLFVSLGGSWKAQKQKTSKGRFLHGKDGEGRFKAFVLGRVVDWKVTYKDDDRYMQYTIQELADSVDEFTLSDESEAENNQTGVEVKISELSKKFHILDQEKAKEKLTPLFALYLSKYPEVTLTIEGARIDPSEVIRNKITYQLNPLKVDDKDYDIELEIVEWSSLKERELWFCNKNGFPLEIYNKQIRGTGEFGYSGYLKSDYFSVLHNDGLLSLGELNRTITEICDAAVIKIKEYFLQRKLESSRDLLDKWKEDKVYPYPSEPTTPVEVAERQVFDIIALNVNQNLPEFEKSDRKTKTFQLRMLRQAVEKSPEDLQLILGEVLQLPKGQQEQLAELLKEASLSGIISAASLVADRLKFVAGIEYLLFDESTKKHLKERSQLHRILAENTWIFGHEYSMSVDDKSLTEVLRKHVLLKNKDIIIDEPVKRFDESVGIVDLMLSRSVPRNHSNELEHLVVELKAPSVKVGEKEIQQIKSYAFAIAKDERFRGLDTRWHFWIISNDINDYAEMELNQERYEDGVIYKSTKEIDITIWVKTWSQLIRENKHRLEFIRDKLNYNIDSADALSHLKKTYAEYTQGLVIEVAEAEQQA